MNNSLTYEELKRWMWGLEQEKRRQQTLRAHPETGATYRDLLDSANDLIQSVAPDGSFLYVNRSWLATLGYHSRDLDTLNVREIIHPDHLDQCMAMFQRVMRGEQLPRVETQFLTENGKTITVEGSINCRFSDGEAVATCGIFRNITERKQADDALRRSEERYRDLLDNAHDLIHSVAPDGTLLYVNPAWRETLGYTDEEIKNMSVMDIIDKSCRDKCLDFFQCLLRGEPLDRNEATFVAKDGRMIEVEGRSRCKFENGRPSAILGIYRDITERKQAEKVLQESAEKVKRFAYSISHDLKSPAIALDGITRLLSRRHGKQLDEKGKKCCQQVVKASSRITELVEKLNEFIAAKEIPLQPESIALEELCRAIEEEFAERLADRGINWRVPPGMPTITGDRLALHRILRNLVDNAVKYGGETLHTIEVGYQETATHHVLSVHDDGGGMSPADSAPLRHRPRPSRASGTGLGLTIVKELVDQHGGEVWHMGGPGNGFVVCFSIAKSLPGLP